MPTYIYTHKHITAHAKRLIQHTIAWLLSADLLERRACEIRRVPLSVDRLLYQSSHHQIVKSVNHRIVQSSSRPIVKSVNRPIVQSCNFGILEFEIVQSSRLLNARGLGLFLGSSSSSLRVVSTPPPPRNMRPSLKSTQSTCFQWFNALEA